MDIMSGDSDLSGSSGENDIYEEDEVVWCKIRGYPWWPGYVGQLIQDQQDEIEYKVYFFGDHSHSCINSDQLRKFKEYYEQFSTLSRKNIRLKQSLIDARNQLRQNGEDVSYFDDDLLKKQKPGRKPKNHHKFSSKKKENESRDDGKQASSFREEGKSSEKYQQQLFKQEKSHKIQSHAHKEKEKEQLALQRMQSEIVVQKRRPGRPRKIVSQNEHTPQPSNYVSHSSQIPSKILRSTNLQNNINLQTPKNIEKQSSSKKKEIQSSNKIERTEEEKCITRLKSLLSRNRFKECMKYLQSLELTSHNIIDVLDSQVFQFLELHLGVRHLKKVKEEAKKVLTHKYFGSMSQQKGVNLSTVSYNSVRGRVIRRLHRLLGQRGMNRKGLAMQLQKQTRNRHSESHEEYMRKMIEMMSRNEKQLKLRNKDMIEQDNND